MAFLYTEQLINTAVLSSTEVTQTSREWRKHRAVSCTVIFWCGFDLINYGEVSKSAYLFFSDVQYLLLERLFPCVKFQYFHPTQDLRRKFYSLIFVLHLWELYRHNFILLLPVKLQSTTIIKLRLITCNTLLRLANHAFSGNVRMSNPKPENTATPKIPYRKYNATDIRKGADL